MIDSVTPAMARPDSSFMMYSENPDFERQP
jgi:hypothetical protein